MAYGGIKDPNLHLVNIAQVLLHNILSLHEYMVQQDPSIFTKGDPTFETKLSLKFH